MKHTQRFALGTALLIASSSAMGSTPPSTSTTPTTTSATGTAAVLTPRPVDASPTVAQVEPIPAVLPYRPSGERWGTLSIIPTVGSIFRSTTGTPAGFGYDSSLSTTVGVQTQLLFRIRGCNCDMQHGLNLGFTYAAGPTLGVFHEAAWRQSIIDLAYSYRLELPCMRRENRRVVLTGTLGLTGAWNDAGLGDVSRDLDDRINDRIARSLQSDHVSLGWRFGVSMDAMFGSFVLGGGIDFRELYGIGTEHARHFIIGANLRIGANFDLGGSYQRTSW